MPEFTLTTSLQGQLAQRFPIQTVLSCLNESESSKLYQSFRAIIEDPSLSKEEKNEKIQGLFDGILPSQEQYQQLVTLLTNNHEGTTEEHEGTTEEHEGTTEEKERFAQDAIASIYRILLQPSSEEHQKNRTTNLLAFLEQARHWPDSTVTMPSLLLQRHLERMLLGWRSPFPCHLTAAPIIVPVFYQGRIYDAITFFEAVRCKSLTFQDQKNQPQTLTIDHLLHPENHPELRIQQPAALDEFTDSFIQACNENGEYQTEFTTSNDSDNSIHDLYHEPMYHESHLDSPTCEVLISRKQYRAVIIDRQARDSNTESKHPTTREALNKHSYCQHHPFFVKLYEETAKTNDPINLADKLAKFDQSQAVDFNTLVYEQHASTNKSSLFEQHLHNARNVGSSDNFEGHTGLILILPFCVSSLLFPGIFWLQQGSLMLTANCFLLLCTFLRCSIHFFENIHKKIQRVQFHPVLSILDLQLLILFCCFTLTSLISAARLKIQLYSFWAVAVPTDALFGSLITISVLCQEVVCNYLLYAGLRSSLSQHAFWMWSSIFNEWTIRPTTASNWLAWIKQKWNQCLRIIWFVISLTLKASIGTVPLLLVMGQILSAEAQLLCFMGCLTLSPLGAAMTHIHLHYITYLLKEAFSHRPEQTKNHPNQVDDHATQSDEHPAQEGNQVPQAEEHAAQEANQVPQAKNTRANARLGLLNQCIKLTLSTSFAYLFIQHGVAILPAVTIGVLAFQTVNILPNLNLFTDLLLSMKAPRSTDIVTVNKCKDNDETAVLQTVTLYPQAKNPPFPAELREHSPQSTPALPSVLPHPAHPLVK